MIKKIALLAALSIFLAGDALAQDPECTPGDPAYNPFDVTSGPYIRPERDIKFCSTRNTAEKPIDDTEPVVCSVKVNGVEIARATLEAGQQATVTDENVNAGVGEIVCLATVVDSLGGKHVVASGTTVFQYEPIPVPEAPTLLLD